jgi:hypothetical protein
VTPSQYQIPRFLEDCYPETSIALIRKTFVNATTNAQKYGNASICSGGSAKKLTIPVRSIPVTTHAERIIPKAVGRPVFLKNTLFLLKARKRVTGLILSTRYNGSMDTIEKPVDYEAAYAQALKQEVFFNAISIWWLMIEGTMSRAFTKNGRTGARPYNH